MDQNLTFEAGIKLFLKKRLVELKHCTLFHTRRMLSKTIEYPSRESNTTSSFPLIGISQNLITLLEKQLSWAVKACFNRNKADTSKSNTVLFLSNYCLIISLLHIFGKIETVCYQQQDLAETTERQF